MNRLPRPELAPFVTQLWASQSDGTPGARELVLPTGAMHLVLRLDEPLRLYDEPSRGAPCRVVGHAIIGGARASSYVRDISRPSASVGAQLRPGAAELLLGVPAIELAEHHTRLDDVWGRFADELRAQLAEAPDPAARLARFEAALLARLPRVRGVHPAVAHALQRFRAGSEVGAVVDEVGYSHRRFIALFEHAVGLTPKRYCRVQRLQRAIAQLPGHPLGEVALNAGFSDQAHLNREFRALVGLSPGDYRARAPVAPLHVPLPAKKP